MSRVLAELLGAAEPKFRAEIARLETAAGLPSADIRLMTHIISEVRTKVRDLGLDPHDTTGRELYGVLQERLKADEGRVRAALGLSDQASPLEITEAVSRFLTNLEVSADSFVLKQSVVRRLLKKLQPKATMKRLGYRSQDSMLKHQPVPHLLAAVRLCESAEWQKRLSDAYGRLHAADFESRRVQFLVPIAKQWPALSETYVQERKTTLLALPEIGAIILLPAPYDLPALAVTSLLLGLDSLNLIRAQGSYLKLQQVRPDFGKIFAHALIQEPLTEAELAGQKLPWQTLQWFYGRGHSPFHPDVFEPHVQPEDLAWHSAETVLTGLHPALEFWQGSELLGLLDGSETVSLNMLDVAIGVTNGLDYTERIVSNMRKALSRELLARYLHQENLQALMLGKLERALVPESIF